MKESKTMAYANDVRTSGNGFIGAVSAIRAAVAERVANYRVYRTTLTELQGLNNRELNDLGISRPMIKRIAIEAAYGDK